MVIVMSKTAFEDAGIDYEAFCDLEKAQLNYKAGHEGLGIKIGKIDDGVYPVYKRYSADGELHQIIIQFGEIDQSYPPGKYLGDVGVDSGQLLITDPCYILDNR